MVDEKKARPLPFQCTGPAPPAGGRVTLGLRECPNWVLLTIKEMGPGVPEALPAGLFGRFNPSVRSRVGGETSTGLGLFITKPIG